MKRTKSNELKLAVHVEHDGLYWVARCPALRMTAAHQQKSAAWMRGFRMFPAQIVYALNHDPALSDLVDGNHPEVLESLRGFQESQQAFTLVLEEVSMGIRAEIPGLHAAAR